MGETEEYNAAEVSTSMSTSIRLVGRKEGKVRQGVSNSAEYDYEVSTKK